MAPPENPSPAAPTEPSQPPPPSAAAKGKGKKKDEKKDDDLSEEDLVLKEQLELYVLQAQHADPGVQKLTLESMRQEIRSATSSITSVPKPLKFLHLHFGTLKSTMPESELKKYIADILSVLALTMSIEGERESLKYRLLGSKADIGSWGHEYVSNATRLCTPTWLSMAHRLLPSPPAWCATQLQNFHGHLNMSNSQSD